jgi:hypothetical protein
MVDAGFFIGGQHVAWGTFYLTKSIDIFDSMSTHLFRACFGQQKTMKVIQSP